MEKSGLIKTVKSQQAHRKKVFMLANIEPSVELTGGVMGQADAAQFDMISNLMDRVFDYVCLQSHVTNRDLVSYMKSQGASVSLGAGLGNLADFDDQGNSGQDNLKNFTDDDYQRLIEAMIFDERIERKPDGFYKPINSSFPYALAGF